MPEKKSDNKKKKSNTKGAKSKVESGKCPKCEKTFDSEDDRLILCDRCTKWYCQKCVGMPDCVYDFLTEENDKRGNHWFCSSCDEEAMTDVRIGNVIQEKCRAMDNKIEDFKTLGLELLCIYLLNGMMAFVADI